MCIQNGLSIFSSTAVLAPEGGIWALENNLMEQQLSVLLLKHFALDRALYYKDAGRWWLVVLTHQVWLDHHEFFFWMLFIYLFNKALQHKCWRSVGHQVLQPAKDVDSISELLFAGHRSYNRGPTSIITGQGWVWMFIRYVNHVLSACLHRDSRKGHNHCCSAFLWESHSEWTSRS